jgi:general secretion pathway protein K
MSTPELRCGSGREPSIARPLRLRRPGFALIAALWIVIAMSAAAFHFSSRSRAHRLAIANSLESSRARAAAEAGIEHARSRIMAALSDGTARPRGIAMQRLIADERLNRFQQDTFALGDTRYTVRLVDAGSMLNINRADEEQLRRFLTALRVDWSDADRIAQAVADWRDADDLHRARGAERDHYLAERMPAVPPNAPFEKEGDLAFVMGMTPAIAERVWPYLTLEGPGLVNVNTAPEPVLRSLPGMTAASADVILRRRTHGGWFRTMQELSDALTPIARQAFLPEMPEFLRHATFHVTELLAESVGWVDGSPVRVRMHVQLVPAGSTVLVPWRRFN